MNYDQALGDAVATINANAYRLGDPVDAGKIDYTTGPGQPEVAMRGDHRYQQKLKFIEVSKRKGKADFFSTDMQSSNEELDHLDAINGKGGYPAMYEDLAAPYKDITPYDIAMAQLNKYQRKIEAPRVEQAVASQSLMCVNSLTETL